MGKVFHIVMGEVRVQPYSKEGDKYPAAAKHIINSKNRHFMTWSSYGFRKTFRKPFLSARPQSQKQLLNINHHLTHVAKVKLKSAVPLCSKQDVHVWIRAYLQWQGWKNLQKDDLFLHQKWSLSEQNRNS